MLIKGVTRELLSISHKSVFLSRIFSSSFEAYAVKSSSSFLTIQVNKCLVCARCIAISACATLLQRFPCHNEILTLSATRTVYMLRLTCARAIRIRQSAQFRRIGSGSVGCVVCCRLNGSFSMSLSRCSPFSGVRCLVYTTHNEHKIR